MVTSVFLIELCLPLVSALLAIRFGFGTRVVCATIGGAFLGLAVYIALADLVPSLSNPCAALASASFLVHGAALGSLGAVLHRYRHEIDPARAECPPS
jgi:hypothetical protein